jgi:hypothetical protein
MLLTAAAAFTAGFAAATPAFADVIYETNGPFGGPFGLIGFDVSPEQSVAVRFTPGADHTLDRLGLWFMNNSDTEHGQVTITLRTDDPDFDIPSEVILEQWQFNITALGWDPMLEQLDSKVHPLLEAGTRYWIVAQSNAAPGFNPVWNWAALDSGVMSICNGNPCEWSPAGESAVSATVVEGTPVLDCPADITGSDNAVNIDDLLAVISAWGECPAPPASCPANIVTAGASATQVDIDDLLAVISAWGPCP